jgi:putative hydrolase of the HAD superfamily
MSHKVMKSILFDMGNVLIEFNPQVIVSAFCEDKKTIELLTQEIYMKEEWMALDRGVMTDEQAESSICLRLPSSLHSLVHTIFIEWSNTIVVHEKMIYLVKQLKAEGYQLYLASNASIRFYDYKDKIKALDEFSGLMISADIHHNKPEAEFYLSLMSRFNLDPKTCFMIDDREENILGALSVGIQGTVYDGDFEHLIETLKLKDIL